MFLYVDLSIYPYIAVYVYAMMHISDYQHILLIIYYISSLVFIYLFIHIYCWLSIYILYICLSPYINSCLSIYLKNVSLYIYLCHQRSYCRWRYLYHKLFGVKATSIHYIFVYVSFYLFCIHILYHWLVWIYRQSIWTSIDFLFIF